MINYNSTFDEVLHHLEQMQMILLSEKESQQVKKITELQKFLDTPEMKSMIAEDLKDEKWIEDTKILVQTAKKRENKNQVIQEHIEQCKNFLIYKILDKKCRNYNLEMAYQNKNWIFNEIEKNGEKSRWLNKKFMNLFTDSSIEKIFMKQSESAIFSINTDWLQKNRDLLFTDKLFENLNFIVLKINKGFRS